LSSSTTSTQSLFVPDAEHPKTLNLGLDTNGNIFGGFAPVPWESHEAGKYFKGDPSLTNFLLTLPIPNPIACRTAQLKSEKRVWAIHWNSGWGWIFVP
jgi:hypothetical protein